MQLRHRFLTSLLLAAPFFGCRSEPSTHGGEVVKQAADSLWQHMLEDDPALRLRMGMKVERLPDVSQAKALRDADLARSVLQRLDSIDPQELSEQQRITLGILRWTARNTVESLDFYWLNFPVTPYATYLTVVHQSLRDFPFEEESDLGRYLGLLDDYGRLIGQFEEILVHQDRLGIRIPREELDLVIPFLRSFIQPVRQSLFQVGPDRLQEPALTDVEGFQQQVDEKISSVVLPALEKLCAFVEGDYREKAPEQVGLWQYPGGKDYYRFLVRYHTTLDLTPEQVHQTGLEAVQRIEAEQADIRRELGWEGSREEFHRFLKTDPRFFPKSPQEVEERLEGFGRKMTARLPQLFGKLPDAPWDVRRLDPNLEASMTFGYYQMPTPQQPHGIYFYNGSNLDQRSWLGFESLAYHELVPGHHFQICLQAGNPDLHPFQREVYYTAFNEGWAEYASFLGVEAGLYEDPYDRYGRLASDLFLATRLVVDTGMNYLEWPREKAAQYMRERVLESDQQIHTETLRYSVDIPGQALGYKIGSLKFVELREKARQALGEQFDVRSFHDSLLAGGAMPMSVLEEHLSRQGF